MSKPKILLIIPSYNEEENVMNVYNIIAKYNENHKDEKVDFIFINDGSTDFTLEILQKNYINHINLISNLGIGGTVQTGYKYAYENGYDVAIQFDGDGQHDINFIETIYQPIISKKADICIGSRYLDTNSSKFQSTFMRRLGKNIISLMIRICCGTKITDPTSGFRAVNREIIKVFAEDYPIDYPEPESIVNLLKNGYIVKEKPVSMNERIGGKSSINPIKSVYYMVRVSIAILIDSMSKTKKRK